ncbi:1-aminocyclopropane-1-carboxylate oxidase-like protein [Bienertia sinuspersici]
MASVTTTPNLSYDRNNELKAFDEAQVGVKGLVDTGLSKVPRIFINQQEHNRITNQQTRKIDLAGIENDPKNLTKIVGEIRDACGNWGFFQIINHGIPQKIVEEMLNGVRGFHELDAEVKKQYYTRDVVAKKFAYFSNYFLYRGPVTNWKDTISVIMSPNPPLPEQLPIVCRYAHLIPRYNTM